MRLIRFVALAALAVSSAPALASLEAPVPGEDIPGGGQGQSASCNIDIGAQEGCNHFNGKVFYWVEGVRHQARACGYSSSECWSGVRAIRKAIRACHGEDTSLRNGAWTCKGND